MPLRPDMEPVEYLDILRRRKWIILFSVFLIHFGAAVYCVLTPDLYQSSIKLLIIPPTVSEGVVRSDLYVSPRQRLNILQQEILSRPRLLGVIKETGLFKGRGSGAEGMVDMVRSRITWELVSEKDTFKVAYSDEDPQVAMMVASRLGAFFIEENIKSREETGQETSKFLAGQVQETRMRLEQQEERMKRYKLEFGGELPQQEQSNLNRLQRLQEQIKNNSDTMARLQDRKVFMEAQISNIERSARMIENSDPWQDVGSAGQAAPRTLLSELARRRKKLAELSEKYTPLYPAVVQARWEVEQLEEKIAQARRAAKKSEGVSSGKATDSSSSRSMPEIENTDWDSAELQRLREQIAAIDLEAVALKRESATAIRTIDQIQKKVERLPQREQELIALTRDYDNIKKYHDELLTKMLEAQVTHKLDEKQKGEQFKLLEPARLPNRPFKPDRLQVLGLALLASLVIGVGGSIGLEMLNPTLRGAKEFKCFFNLPILASLPIIQDDRTKRRIAVQRAAIVGGLVSILGAYMVFLAVHAEKVKFILRSFGLTIGGGN
jgi:polysaccharide chain length determinant protein (PEP-CTERM system associated)